MFGNGDLLLGRGGFDSSNGFGNEGTNVSNAQGQSGSSAFDLSDFPSLGGSLGGNSGGDNSNPDGIAVAFRQQQQLMQQQLMQSGGTGINNKPSQLSGLYRLAMGSSLSGSVPTGSNFNVASEDFPALPGAPLGSGGSSGNSGSGLLGGSEGISSVNGSNSNSFGAARIVSSGGFGASGDLEGFTNQFDSSSLLVGSSIKQHQSRPLTTNGSNTGVSGSNGGSVLSGDYGLLGLLKVIRMTDADRNALALGSDLTSLGLNLNSSDSLYSNFASPWSESPTSREPQYQVSFFIKSGGRKVSVYWWPILN